MVDIGRPDANIIHETECDFVETDIMDDIGYDKAVGARLVVETFKSADLEGCCFKSRIESVRVGINGIGINHFTLYHNMIHSSPSVAVQLVIDGG